MHIDGNLKGVSLEIGKLRIYFSKRENSHLSVDIFGLPASEGG